MNEARRLAETPAESSGTGIDGAAEGLRLLLVEDSAEDAALIQASLRRSKAPLTVTHVTRLDAALRALADSDAFDCVLLDLNLPDSQGTRGLGALRRHYPELAVVVLTGLDDSQAAAQAIQNGAQEYLVKGEVTGNGLLRLLRHAQARAHMEAERLRQQQQQYLLATHDPLTGLANRSLLQEHADRILPLARRQQHVVACCYFDLDKFKLINDQYGHGAGDQALVAFAQSLAASVRATDVCARLGGDEFLVLLAPLTSAEHAAIICERVFNHMAGANLGYEDIRLTASAGTAIFPDQGETLDLLIQHADTAMYQVKRGGGRGRTALAPQRRRR